MVVGFGGYPSAPALVGAILDRRPTVIHEQNAVMGRANRMLAGRVTHRRLRLPDAAEGAAAGGRPRRSWSAIRCARRSARWPTCPTTPPGAEGPIRLLVTGGSQGARLLSELVPEAIAALPEDLRQRLVVQQQTRPESMEIARRTYRNAMVDAEIAPFFRDMAEPAGARPTW